MCSERWTFKVASADQLVFEQFSLERLIGSTES